MTQLREWIIRWFIPPELQVDEKVQWQAIRAILFGFAMLVWVPVFTPLYILLGSPQAGLIIAGVAFATLGVMFSLRFTKSITLTGNLIAGMVYLVLLCVAAVAGGINAAATWWLCAVPIIGLILCGVRSGICWTIACCLAASGFFLVDLFGLTPFNDMSQHSLRLLDTVSICGIVGCAFLLTLTFKLGEDAARRALETARDASEQANRAKSMLLANMSHEIRTPMNAIIGMADLVLATDLSRDQQEYLKIMQQSGESLLVLLDDILDFSVIEARRFELRPQPFDLYESLRHTLKALGARAHKRGLELICRFHTDVPCRIVGDKDRLRQIVVNLIGNAIKFTEEGEIVFEVRRGACTENDVCLYFAVSDTGIGIPQDKQAVIFDVFEQAEMSSTRRFGGAGLGLSISSELVQMMRGHIGVESEVGRGSRFFFTACFGCPEPERSPTARFSVAHLRERRVLIVDDNASSRQVLEETLWDWEMAPAAVDSAGRAVEALREAQRSGNPFQVAIVDAHMPDVDGINVATAIRDDQDLDCRIILMRAAGDRPQRDDSWDQRGVQTHILKPVTPPELLSALCSALGIPHVASVASSRGILPMPAQQPLSILLVEDSLVNQTLAVTILRNNGHSVTVANDGQAGLEAWSRQRFDLILMDIQMPVMDGVEATQAIRVAERDTGDHVPIIALTAHAIKGDRERFLAAGMDAYLSKPLRSEKLLDIIGETLQRLSAPPPS